MGSDSNSANNYLRNLGEVINLSEHPFPDLKLNGEEEKHNNTSIIRINEMIQFKFIEQCLCISTVCTTISYC